MNGEVGIKTNNIVDDQSERIAKSGGSWFFWIAGLSVINTILYSTGSDLNFIIGLGTTQFVGGFGDAVGGQAIVIADLITLIIVGVFIVFGVYSRKKKNWAFVAGIAFYALDGLLFLWVQDWLGIAFHVFALVFIIRGAIACFRINKMRQGVRVQQ